MVPSVIIRVIRAVTLNTAQRRHTGGEYTSASHLEAAIRLDAALTAGYDPKRPFDSVSDWPLLQACIVDTVAECAWLRFQVEREENPA